MDLPFTIEQFFGVFRDYNEALWPVQPVLIGLALLTIGLIASPRPWSGAAVSIVLALLWSWLALAYHVAFFASINPLAYLFAALSLAGALVFVWQGAIRRRLEFRVRYGLRAPIGIALVTFALVVYPLWSWYAGHRYPAMPTFGLPCPTTVFTIGVLAFAVPPYPRSPLVAPLLWSAIGAQAAFLLDVPQDLSLILAAVVGLGLLVRARGPVKSTARLGD